MVGEDITAIKETLQHSRIHQWAKNGKVLLFRRYMQCTAALITATAHDREDNGASSEGDIRNYVQRLWHNHWLNDEDKGYISVKDMQITHGNPRKMHPRQIYAAMHG